MTAQIALLNIFNQTKLAQAMANKLALPLLDYELRRFPDGESYFRLLRPEQLPKQIIIITDLHQPDNKLMPLCIICDELKQLGVTSIGLVTPYLPYMRQDKAFHSGEAVSSKTFAKLLSQFFSWLVTVDPHLHRYHALSEIYTIPSQLVHANHAIATWVKANVEKPVLIGPDSESEQWLAKISAYAELPFTILEKHRHGDYDVDVSTPKLQQYLDHTPVLIDDIISTAKTMLATIAHLQALHMSPAVCIGVHAVFSAASDELLLASHVRQLITCNTIAHKTNQIDLLDDILSGVKFFIK